ncbi:MAG TPA: hypothetical protein VJ860_14490 [Polyangia bacterium]|nr:hypothetical protein [Polyangia bacterium]
MKTMLAVSGWLNEPDVAEGDADIDRMDPLNCAQDREEFGRPLFNRMAAPPSLVSRMMRKTMGQPAAPARHLYALAEPSPTAGLTPAVALALSEE